MSSLPFSDHCQPLATSLETVSLLQAMIETREQKHLKYVELRPLTFSDAPEFTASDTFLFHSLDLRPSKEEIFGKLHPNCIRRKIRRATKEALAVESGTSEKLIDEFFTMQIHTRRKHGLPPQPKQWFRNLVSAMEGKATIRLARYRGRPVCSILTLRHKKTEIYKYGCSEAEDNNLGGMQLLLWQTIEEAKDSGMDTLDLGRCDIGNTGLALFKERWGAERREIRYFKYPPQQSDLQNNARNMDLAVRIFSKLPDPVLALVGRFLYRHIA